MEETLQIVIVELEEEESELQVKLYIQLTFAAAASLLTGHIQVRSEREVALPE